MRPCSLRYCARATEYSALRRRSYTHGSRLLSNYERPPLSGHSSGTPTNTEEHANRTQSHEWVRSQSNPRHSGIIPDQALSGNRTPSFQAPRDTSNEQLEGSGDYFEALQSSADALPRPKKERRPPPKDLLGAARALAEKLKRRGVGDEYLARDAFLMSLSLFREKGEAPAWSRNIHILHTLTHREKSNFEKWEHLEVRDWDTVATWVQELTGEGEGPAAYSLTWQQLPLKKKRERWADVVLWLLLNSPTQALMFLQATSSVTPSPPFSVLSDSFHYLAQHYYRPLFSSGPLKEQFEQYLLHCLRPKTWPTVGTAQNGLWLYFRLRRQSSLSTAFYLKFYRRMITASTGLLLYFVDRFTRANDINNALFCLKLAYRRGKKTPTFNHLIRKRCCKLLLLDDISETQGVRDFIVLRGILDIGIKLNRPMYNIVLTNALRIGDHQLAWEIYELMENEGSGADSYAYLTLLQDAIRRGDTESVGYVLRIIRANPRLRTQKQLASKTLHAIRTLSQDVLSERWTYANTYNAMLELYCDVHDRQPLVDLGIIAPEGNGFAPLGDTSPPSAHALTIMISAFAKAQSDPAVIRHVFKRFYRHILEGHPSIAPLAETDHTWNAFLTGMAGHADLLNDCVEVVETMLRPFEEEVTLQGDGRIIHKANPTVQTWTILLSAFLWSQQPRTAFTVRDMMLKRGVAFNQVTWNVMIRGFASMQMVDETAAALKMMERENWPQDAHTVKAVSMIHDQERLRWALDRFDKEDAASPDADPELRESNYAASSPEDNLDFARPGHDPANNDTEVESFGIDDSTARNIDSSTKLPAQGSSPADADTIESPQSDYTAPDTTDHMDVYREMMEYEQPTQTNTQ